VGYRTNPGKTGLATKSIPPSGGSENPSAGLSLVNRKRTEPKKRFGFAMPKETNGNKSSFPKN